MHKKQERKAGWSHKYICVYLVAQKDLKILKN